MDGVNTLPIGPGGNHTDSLVHDCHAPSFLAQEQWGRAYECPYFGSPMLEEKCQLAQRPLPRPSACAPARLYRPGWPTCPALPAFLADLPGTSGVPRRPVRHFWPSWSLGPALLALLTDLPGTPGTPSRPAGHSGHSGLTGPALRAVLAGPSAISGGPNQMARHFWHSEPPCLAVGYLPWPTGPALLVVLADLSGTSGVPSRPAWPSGGSGPNRPGTSGVPRRTVRHFGRSWPTCAALRALHEYLDDRAGTSSVSGRDSRHFKCSGPTRWTSNKMKTKKKKTMM